MPKDIRLNSTHYFIMTTSNKQELQQTVTDHSPDIDSKIFTRIYRKCTTEPYSFLVNDTYFLSNNPLRFRQNLLVVM